MLLLRPLQQARRDGALSPAKPLLIGIDGVDEAAEGCSNVAHVALAEADREKSNTALQVGRCAHSWSCAALASEHGAVTNMTKPLQSRMHVKV